MIDQYRPLRSLRAGHWFKLICGASYQHLPTIRHLTLAYTLAGADCIDVAADPAVVQAAREGLQAAAQLYQSASLELDLPWLMVSLNDGQDPHFRKAQFDPTHCLAACPQPCVSVCPAQAIALTPADGFAGVLEQRCYGCGRCLPVCPIEHITTHSQVYPPAAVGKFMFESGIDALEIHTQIGRQTEFRHLWQAIAANVDHLKLVAVSCPDGEGLIQYLEELYQILSPLPCPLIWQTDGRPMSGDIGTGTTRATIKLAQKVLAARLPGYVQLAGGTNRHTVPKLRALGLLNPQLGQNNSPSQVCSQPFIAGVAYGSYARALLAPILEADTASTQPLADPQRLQQAVATAASVVSQLKPLPAPVVERLHSGAPLVEP